MQTTISTNTQSIGGIFAILAGQTRLKIIEYLLQKEAEAKQVCVNEIADAIDKSHSATSHQLSRLEDNGVVISQRTGQKICYLLADNKTVKVIKAIMQQVHRHA